MTLKDRILTEALSERAVPLFRSGGSFLKALWTLRNLNDIIICRSSKIRYGKYRREGKYANRNRI